MIKILFVCMGNICRSPTAEGFFARAMERSVYKDRISIDSAGTHSYHIGHTPDPRAVETAARYGVDISHLRARKVSVSDFHSHDLIVAMDEGNLMELRAMKPAGARADLKLMMEYHPGGHAGEVPDPYYGGMGGFRFMCDLLEAATAGLLEEVEKGFD